MTKRTPSGVFLTTAVTPVSSFGFDVEWVDCLVELVLVLVVAVEVVVEAVVV